MRFGHCCWGHDGLVLLLLRRNSHPNISFRPIPATSIVDASFSGETPKSLHYLFL